MTLQAEEKAKTEKSEMSAQLDSEINALSTELQQTTDAEAADQNFLADLTTQCADLGLYNTRQHEGHVSSSENIHVVQ